MPISTSSFGDDRDDQYGDYERSDLFEQETMAFDGINPAQAEDILKRLGGGVAEKHKLLEGIGWRATISQTSSGVEVLFDAHDELLDDLLRRFELMAEKEQG